MCFGYFGCQQPLTRDFILMKIIILKKFIGMLDVKFQHSCDINWQWNCIVLYCALVVYVMKSSVDVLVFGSAFFKHVVQEDAGLATLEHYG